MAPSCMTAHNIEELLDGGRQVVTAGILHRVEQPRIDQCLRDSDLVDLYVQNDSACRLPAPI
jgi:hypothetical protein